MEVSKTNYPDQFNGNTIYPIKGTSLLSFTKGETSTIHSKNYVFGLEHTGLTMLRKGQWKLTNIDRPFTEDNFKLYNLENDLAELHDLSQKEPEKYDEMLHEWRAFAKNVKAQFPE